MVLIFNVEVWTLGLVDNECKHVITVSKEQTIIYVYDEDDVIMVKYTLIDQWLLKTDVTQLVSHALTPNATSLFLLLEVCKEIQQ